MIGNKLFLFEIGFSPIIPELCAPTGLKYLKIAPSQLFRKCRSVKISSIVFFVFPYTLEGINELSSLIGQF